MSHATVCVDRREAQRAIEALRRNGALVSGLRPAPVENLVCLPVVSERALEILASLGVPSYPPPQSVRFEERKRLPSGLPAHVIVGDIVVFNMRYETPREVYEEAARTIMSYVPRVRVALLKRDTWGELRTQRIEHLLGERRTETIHKEYGLLFHVDLATTYFNPRLAEEHRRVAERCAHGERVLDMFAGVGGFSLHIASRCGSLVVATDLNVYAVSSLAKNISMNRRKLIGEIIAMRADAEALPRLLRPVFNRIIIDNPTAAPRFLPAALALAAEGAELHYYTLSYSCETALEEVAPIEELSVIECRRALEHSPSRSIYSILARVQRGPEL